MYFYVGGGGGTGIFAYNLTFKLIKNISLNWCRVFKIEDKSVFKNNFNFFILIVCTFPFLIFILILLPTQPRGEGTCPAFTFPHASV
jgi:hypothetical protein